jgi:hypothetical protein
VENTIIVSDLRVVLRDLYESALGMTREKDFLWGDGPWEYSLMCLLELSTRQHRNNPSILCSAKIYYCCSSFFGAAKPKNSDGKGYER